MPMFKTAPVNAASSRPITGWQTACWVLLLLGALGGLMYSHYSPNPNDLAEIGTTASASTSTQATAAAGRAETLRFSLWLLGAVALLGLLWNLLRHAQRTEKAFARLRGNAQIACDEITGATASAENAIAQWKVGAHTQAEELRVAAQGVSALAEAITRISESAAQSSERASHSTQVVEKGMAAAGDAVAALNNTRTRMETAAERLGESARRIGETAGIIRDSGAQADLIFLNISIQTARAGGAGRECAEAADEMRRLGERSAWGAGEIGELARQLQDSAGGVVAAMQAATGELSAGAALVDEIGRALDEIEGTGRELLAATDLAATDAAGEAARAQAVGEALGTLERTAEQANKRVSAIAHDVGKAKLAARELTGVGTTGMPSTG